MTQCNQNQICRTQNSKKPLLSNVSPYRDLYSKTTKSNGELANIEERLMKQASYFSAQHQSKSLHHETPETCDILKSKQAIKYLSS